MTGSQGSTQIYHCINGATATTSSGWLPITGAKSVQVVCKRSDHSSGSTAFTGTIAVDKAGDNSFSYKKFIDNVNNTNGEQLTRITTKTLSSDTTEMMAMSPEDIGGFLRITATETTDGTHDAWVIVKF